MIPKKKGALTLEDKTFQAADDFCENYKKFLNKAKTEREAVTALIEVKVEPQLGDGFDRVAERIYQYEEVESCYLMSGDFDMTVIISGRTLREVANFVTQKLSTIDAVQSTATHFILKKYKENHLIFNKEREKEEGFCFV